MEEFSRILTTGYDCQKEHTSTGYKTSGIPNFPTRIFRKPDQRDGTYMVAWFVQAKDDYIKKLKKEIEVRI